ncbi:hypothetical protein Y032_0056g2701 [Ancylostoma ceylanicum]|uniref:Uncharacterized protein n=1 Tax=Ancylostoma ceylanicum TaxID=53326 RepID=A0A016U4X3_9BILA|nr:hypothetical protein Y032_0056g2701 [Ancylostoma ceylanicum]
MATELQVDDSSRASGTAPEDHQFLGLERRWHAAPIQRVSEYVHGIQVSARIEHQTTPLNCNKCAVETRSPQRNTSSRMPSTSHLPSIAAQAFLVLAAIEGGWQQLRGDAARLCTRRIALFRLRSSRLLEDVPQISPRSNTPG